MREENIRQYEVNQELTAMKSAKMAKNQDTEWKTDLLFPTTTNQDYINDE